MVGGDERPGGKVDEEGGCGGGGGWGVDTIRFLTLAVEREEGGKACCWPLWGGRTYSSVIFPLAPTGMVTWVVSGETMIEKGW